MSETEHHPDGREGIRCPDCGAFLQAVQMGGAEFLRCPWANPRLRNIELGEPTKIYCGSPLIGPRSTTPMFAVANQ